MQKTGKRLTEIFLAPFKYGLGVLGCSAAAPLLTLATVIGIATVALCLSILVVGVLGIILGIIAAIVILILIIIIAVIAVVALFISTIAIGGIPTLSLFFSAKLILKMVDTVTGLNTSKFIPKPSEDKGTDATQTLN